MIREFMHMKFDFSTWGHAILFAHTTTLTSLNPFPLVATPLPISIASSLVNFNLFVIDPARKIP
jgi:hypothetical protein